MAKQKFLALPVLLLMAMQAPAQTVTSGQDSAGKTTVLSTVVISSKNRGKYRNKDNPAVELIRKVIANKARNRPESFDYVSYEKYEKAEICLRNLQQKKLDRPGYKPYRFLLAHPDSLMEI